LAPQRVGGIEGRSPLAAAAAAPAPPPAPSVRSPPPSQELEPLDILLVKRDGRFSGEAFLLLGGAAQIQLALDKNKSYMGRRYVEVFRAKKLVGSRRRAAAARGGGGWGAASGGGARRAVANLGEGVG
jgi:hypothetical protein